MLKSLDVLIGLSVVMLIGSFVVTLLTHAVTTFVNTRGRHLFRGLVDIIRYLDPAMEQKIAEEISSSVLKNPMVSEVSHRFASVVSREELTTLLLDFAAGAGVQKLTEPALAALRAALQKNQVSNPDQTLSNIRDLVLRLERSHPELANSVRMNMAILNEAPSAFVAKINAWFDQTIDRVRLRFTASTRLITFALASLTAVAVQMDTIAIVNRLYTDPALRQKLVENASKVSADLAPGAAPGTTTPQGNPPASSSTGQGSALNDRLVADVDVILGQSGVFSVPAWSWAWVGGFVPLPVWSSFSMQKFLGVFLSAALLSLGAPFWYEALKTMLKLRSSLAESDDAQRLERQTTQRPSAPSGGGSNAVAAAPSVPRLTEAGDLNLNAVG